MKWDRMLVTSVYSWMMMNVTSSRMLKKINNPSIEPGGTLTGNYNSSELGENSSHILLEDKNKNDISYYNALVNNQNKKTRKNKAVFRNVTIRTRHNQNKINILNDKCPKYCTCNFLSLNKANIIDCREAGLRSMPLSLPIHPEATHTKLYLQGNLLTEVTILKRNGYDNVTHYNLSSNRIMDFNMEQASDSLKILDLRKNNLSVLPPEVLVHFERSGRLQVALGGNPWACQCSAAWRLNSWYCDCPMWRLVTHLQVFPQNVKDLFEIHCSDGRLLIDIDKGQLCFSWSVHIIVGVPLVCIIFIFIYMHFRDKVRKYFI